MTTATVTGPLLADDGVTPLPNRQVTFDLPGGGHITSGELARKISVITDVNGQFSVVLPINPEITPAGSYYLVTAPGLDSWRIALPSAGTWHVGDPAIQVLVTTPTPAGATTPYVDSLIAALDTRIDVLEAAPATPVTAAAITGFFDLANQSRTMFRTTSSGTAQNPIVALKAGRIVGMSVVATTARTGGTATFTAMINGADTTIVAVLDGTTPNFAHVTGSIAFNAGDRIQPRHVDAAFTPSTNYEATIWVEYN